MLIAGTSSVFQSKWTKEVSIRSCSVPIRFPMASPISMFFSAVVGVAQLINRQGGKFVCYHTSVLWLRICWQQCVHREVLYEVWWRAGQVILSLLWNQHLQCVCSERVLYFFEYMPWHYSCSRVMIQYLNEIGDRSCHCADMLASTSLSSLLQLAFLSTAQFLILPRLSGKLSHLSLYNPFSALLTHLWLKSSILHFLISVKDIDH